MAHIHKKIGKKTKKGLSNIVGSLLLIVLTIVAALLIGHFVFGLFSANSHNAGISISDASVIIPAGEYTTNGASVTITITDSGNDPLVLQYVTLVANGNSYTLFGGGKTYIKPVSTVYQKVGNGYLIEPGQSLTLQGVISSANGPALLQTGQTVVFQVSGVDNVTAQSLSQQMSVVIQD
ncbi:archaellin/type IV pilin N-terminal domain-containing protein [Stygiolobus caldivivus]|uniref:Archaeal Type IV pilin N-terminal domain-containing protein n=1 Tax=Stygiolobus caldivivus TaxID=2824673 RepID=A0A8D5U8K9_9CREN|nr:archaellin/type IV pilin N-terminal domain-containing protein [Stygiolobus caldivivus]BCU70942.1 hypothetical protein KN1_22390 [Stygiolobus caldivivus]